VDPRKSNTIRSKRRFDFQFVRLSICSTLELKGMSRTMLCNTALLVRLSNFYSSFKQNFSRIFCSSFKLFENQTVRLSRVHCISIFTTSATYFESKGSSSGNWLYLPVYFYDTGRYKRLPEEEPLCSIHVEDNVKIKILFYQRCILLVHIIRSHKNARYKTQKRRIL
jgi:hypothetical protein